MSKSVTSCVRDKLSGQLSAGFSVVKKDSECKYSERECWEVAWPSGLGLCSISITKSLVSSNLLWVIS